MFEFTMSVKREKIPMARGPLVVMRTSKQKLCQDRPAPKRIESAKKFTLAAAKARLGPSLVYGLRFRLNDQQLVPLASAAAATTP